MARKFFFVCAGLLCLAIAFHLGATTAGAQAPSNSVVAATENGYLVFTANGDYYYSQSASPEGGGHFVHIGNLFSGGSVNVQKGTLGELKARFR